MTAQRIRQRPAIHMQRLRAAVMRIRRTNIQTTQLEIRAQHHLDSLQHLRSLDDGLEDRALIHRIRNAPCARLSLELAPRAIALDRE